MKKTIYLLLVIIFVNFICILQTSFCKETNSTIFSNVHCLLLINYSNGLSSGEYVYSRYSIKKGKSEFIIEAKDRNKLPHSWYIPFTKPEMRKINETDTSGGIKFLEYLPNAKSHNYFSEKQSYKVNDTAYTVYKHINYNCYDPFCGSKHSHTTFSTGVTYFSPDYGILIEIDDQNMQFNLMASMKEKKVPHNLIIEILKSRKIDEKIIRHYISKTR